MRLLLITPGAVGFKSPTVYVAEELIRRGHKVALVQDGTGSKIVAEGDFDVVFGDMERSCIPAYLSAITLGVNCYLHLEWVPEFRVQQTDKYGPGCVLSEEEIKQWRGLYKPIAAIADEAAVCSCASPIFQKFAEEWLGFEYHNCFSRFTRLPSNVPDKPISMSGVEHAVVICSRIAPIKRIPMLVEAVGRMKTKKPKVYIVGDGPEKPLVYQVANTYGVDVELCGAQGGEKKWDYIARSKLMLSAWTGIPPGEALMLGRPTLAYEYEHIGELYNDALFYTKNNDIDEMAANLDEMLEDTSTLESFALEGRQKLLDGQIGLQTFERGVDEIEQTLQSII